MIIKNKQGGSSIILLPIAALVIGLIGFTAWRITAPGANKGVNGPLPGQSAELVWQQGPNGWESKKTPPQCPKQPMLKAPADVTKATSVLYPGQPRGGNYKPHGGLRFDTTKDNAITVTAPIDGYLVRGGSYIAEGEVQYTFDVMNNCGVMYRVGHIRELPANLQKIANSWPEPSANSATQSVNPPLYIKTGDTLGTKVGILGSNNTFFDWGVYDYRQENEASKLPAYQAAQSQYKELSWHAVCWLDGWLASDVEQQLAKLPAGDPASGKKSDYCR